MCRSTATSLQPTYRFRPQVALLAILTPTGGRAGSSEAAAAVSAAFHDPACHAAVATACVAAAARLNSHAPAAAVLDAAASGDFPAAAAATAAAAAASPSTGLEASAKQTPQAAAASALAALSRGPFAMPQAWAAHLRRLVVVASRASAGDAVRVLAFSELHLRLKGITAAADAAAPATAPLAGVAADAARAAAAVVAAYLGAKEQQSTRRDSEPVAAVPSDLLAGEATCMLGGLAGPDTLPSIILAARTALSALSADVSAACCGGGQPGADDMRALCLVDALCTAVFKAAQEVAPPWGGAGAEADARQWRARAAACASLAAELHAATAATPAAAPGSGDGGDESVRRARAITGRLLAGPREALLAATIPWHEPAAAVVAIRGLMLHPAAAADGAGGAHGDR